MIRNQRIKKIVLVHGTVGIVPGLSSFKGVFRKQSFEGQGRFMDVWLQNGESWQLIAGQVTPVERL